MRIRMIRTDHSPSPDLPEAAVAYALAGVAILPCRPAGPRAKAPYTAHGVKDASVDLATVSGWWRRWPDALIGVAIPPTAVVLDIDPRNGGSRQALEAVVGPLPETLEVVSGRGDGGVHRYYSRPHVKLGKHVRELPGVDILTNGYVIAPPSPHPATGQPYRASGLYRLDNLPPLTERAVEVFKRPPKAGVVDTRAGRSRLGGGTGGTMTPERVTSLVGLVRRAPVRHRNDLLFWAASRVAEDCTSNALDGVLRRLGEAALEAGLDVDEVAKTLASARARRR